MKTTTTIITAILILCTSLISHPIATAQGDPTQNGTPSNDVTPTATPEPTSTRKSSWTLSFTSQGNTVTTGSWLTETPEPTIPGDINLDTLVNVIDLQILISMILNPTHPDSDSHQLEWWERGDIDGDGGWNVLDLQQLISLIQQPSH